jgi:hypothetical protein
VSTTTTHGAAGAGPLTERVLAYTRVMRDLVPSVTSPADWAPLADYVDVDRFERVGTFLEVQDWPAYADMLTRWAASIESFETTVRRVTETPELVYFEIEERHHAGGRVNTVNSLTVFAFGTDGRITHLDVFLQQAR